MKITASLIALAAAQAPPESKTCPDCKVTKLARMIIKIFKKKNLNLMNNKFVGLAWCC